MDQRYSAEDHRQHIGWLSQAFRDRRYLRIDGKPVFLVYRLRACRIHLTPRLSGERKRGGLGWAISICAELTHTTLSDPTRGQWVSTRPWNFSLTLQRSDGDHFQR